MSIGTELPSSPIILSGSLQPSVHFFSNHTYKDGQCYYVHFPGEIWTWESQSYIRKLKAILGTSCWLGGKEKSNINKQTIKKCPCASPCGISCKTEQQGVKHSPASLEAVLLKSAGAESQSAWVVQVFGQVDLNLCYQTPCNPDTSCSPDRTKQRQTVITTHLPQRNLRE